MRCHILWHLIRVCTVCYNLSAPLLRITMVNIVQVDPTTLSSKEVELYKMLISLLEQEAKCVEAVRESEEEVCEILNDRTREETAQELEISVYDTERNEKAKKHRRELVSDQMFELGNKKACFIPYASCED